MLCDLIHAKLVWMPSVCFHSKLIAKVSLFELGAESH